MVGLRAALGFLLMAAATVVPAAARDLGFSDLTETIADATKGSPAIIPFIERPTTVDVGFGGRAQAFGYLGSVANPQIAYPAGQGSSPYYRADTSEKCNPDQFVFPAGQQGLERFAYQKYFKFELKGGELTFKGGKAGDKAFNLTAVSARVLRRVKVTITDLKEYTLDFRTLRDRVAQVAADPVCATYKMALTKVYEGKVTATYYFEAGAEAGLKADVGAALNFSLGLSAVVQDGGSDAEPNTLQFTSEPRVFAAKFRPVADILGRAPVARKVATQN